MVIETASGRKVFERTRLDNTSSGFVRVGYARKCDYDYRPRLGLNIEEEGWMNRENVQHEHEENQPGPRQKEENANKKGGTRPRCATLHRISKNNTYRPKKKTSG